LLNQLLEHFQVQTCQLEAISLKSRTKFIVITLIQLPCRVQL